MRASAFLTRSSRLLGEPLRHTAHALSYLALFWSVGVGYGWIGPTPPAYDAVTLTLLVYGLAYTLRLRLQLTSEAVASCAVTLTAAYLHILFTHSVLLGMRASSFPSLFPMSPLSGPRFAQLAVDAGIVWLAVGWHVRRSLKRRDLAQPLLTLAGALALFSGVIGLLTIHTPHEGKWTILALGWSGAIWFGLWLLEQGEVCLHLGTGSLLLAWSLILYDRYGLDLRMLDLYLLPVGLYLVTLGHLTCRRQRLDRAHWLWWAGLLLMLTPTFLAYWQHASEWHTVLLVAECLVVVLWGISQRIRSFVSAGMLFTIAFAASCSIGHVPEIWGTFSALAAGVGLFIAGFYVLTHREVVQRWVSPPGKTLASLDGLALTPCLIKCVFSKTNAPARGPTLKEPDEYCGVKTELYEKAQHKHNSLGHGQDPASPLRHPGCPGRNFLVGIQAATSQ